jgi:phenylpropionate dioxygenase-like ring-hydroxylating dioxygenase large terminal subunit
VLKNFWYAVEFGTAVTTKPKQVTLMGQHYVLYRDTNCQVVALDDRCAHRGAALSGGWVEEGCLRCPYHGWSYQPDGACVQIPANQADVPISKRAQVGTYPVQEKYGFVWIFVGDLPEPERPPIPPFPEFGDPAWRQVQGEYVWKAHYTRVIESGLDTSHAPFVHAAFFNNRDDAEVWDYEVQSEEWSTSATVRTKPPKRVGLLKYIVKRDRPFSSAKLTVYMPNINRIALDFNFRGYQYIYFATNIPIDETTTLTKWIGVRNFLTQPWADYNSIKNTVDTYREDKAVIEAQEPRVVPYGVTEEVLVASDNLLVAYRKLLRKFLDKGWGIGDYSTNTGHKSTPSENAQYSQLTVEPLATPIVEQSVEAAKV